ncbi:MAG TPA: energy-coupling factor transporter transmembrane protein EcfT [Acidothermaceae bacterium]
MTRPLHPGAWWAWALLLATAATRTTNPLLLGLALGVASFVVAGRRTPRGGRAFGFFVRLGAFVLAIRLVFETLFGSPLPGHVLVRLPSVPLPSALAGLRIGGAVTAESLVSAGYGGLQLATLLICLGAANSLASPRRLLRSLPGALYELGVAVTVAMSFAPQLVLAGSRVRRARRLRGKSTSGLRGWVGSALPVLQDGLESSIDLAAAMDSRGFGRRGPSSRTRARAASSALLIGMLAVAAAMYGLLAAGSPALIGLPLLLGGSGIAAAAVLLGGHGVVRTKYRPDAWGAPEWLVVAAGLAAVLGMIGAGRVAPGSLHTGAYPIVAPALPWPAVVGLAMALLPAFLSTKRPASSRRIETGELIGAAR